MKISEIALNRYKKIIFSRQDDDGSVFYFSCSDFKNLKSHPYTFKSSKGYDLKGYFYYYDNFKENRIVIFEHGLGPGHKAYFKEIEMLAKHGYLVFSYDHSGCNESMGETTGGSTQSLVDLNDCLDSLKRIEQLKNYTYSIVGHSWGAAATLNIANLHDDITHLIAISGFASIKDMVKQIFPFYLIKAKKKVIELERKSNPDFVDYDGVEALKRFKGNALLIYSKDDKVVNYKYHYNRLYKNLKDRKNISFMLVDKKGHNPNYTVEAVEYKNIFFKEHKQAIKNNKLLTDSDKVEFIKQYDWDKMTTQDIKVWQKIFETLDK